MREKLPDRRPNAHASCRWEGHEFSVCVGFHVDAGWQPGSAGNPREEPLGRAAEVFAYGPKTGAALRFVVEDGCVLASHLAQRGMRFAEQAAVVARLGSAGDTPPPDERRRPASPMGAILDVAAELEAAARPERNEGGGEPARAGGSPPGIKKPEHNERTE